MSPWLLRLAALAGFLAWGGSPRDAPRWRSLSSAGPEESNQRRRPKKHPIPPRTAEGVYLSTSQAGHQLRPGSTGCPSFAEAHVVRERDAGSFGTKGIALPDHVSLDRLTQRAPVYAMSGQYQTRGKAAPGSRPERNRMLSEALLFGYFLLSQQEKVTAGGARPAGCFPRPEPSPAPSGANRDYSPLTCDKNHCCANAYPCGTRLFSLLIEIDPACW